MKGNKQSRTATFVVLIGVIGALIPAALAAGTEDAPVVSGDSSVVLLTLGKQDKVSWEGLTQGITTRKNDCTAVQFAASPQLLVVSAIGGTLGEVKDGLGVKSAGDGAGEPCGRVEADDGESISVALGQSLAGHLMTEIDVDLELKFNATVAVAYLLDGATVATDIFNPMESSDDGPDSADLDNYRYHHSPEVLFDEIVFTATSGAFSLEGGADGTTNGSLAANNSSQFLVAASFDGEITCGDDVEIGVQGSLESTYGTVTMHAMDLDSEVDENGEWQVADCFLKLYNADAIADALAFIPELENTQGRYTLEVTVPNQTIEVSEGPTPPAGTITSLIAEYDPTGGLTFPSGSTFPVQACQGQPITDSSDSGYAAFWTQDDPIQAQDPATLTMADLLPPGEQICFYRATVTPTSPGVGTESWGFFFLDDPSVRFK